eukprot:1107165-Pleurochrysis_carterae.AAC.1
MLATSDATSRNHSDPVSYPLLATQSTRIRTIMHTKNGGGGAPQKVELPGRREFTGRNCPVDVGSARAGSDELDAAARERARVLVQVTAEPELDAG